MTVGLLDCRLAPARIIVLLVIVSLLRHRFASCWKLFFLDHNFLFFSKSGGGLLFLLSSNRIFHVESSSSFFIYH